MNDGVSGYMQKWWKCSKDDWLEAFRAHPRIGDVSALRKVRLPSSSLSVPIISDSYILVPGSSSCLDHPMMVQGDSLYDGQMTDICIGIIWGRNLRRLARRQGMSGRRMSRRVQKGLVR